MKKPSKSSPQFNWISIDDFEYICFNLAKELMEFNEPIPDYSTADRALLESSLASPRQAFELQNSSFEEQASILFYSLIKNHPFRNGNKRIAVMTMLIFFSLNNRWLEIPQGLLYEMAVLVAKSRPSERDFVIRKNKELFEEFGNFNKT